MTDTSFVNCSPIYRDFNIDFNDMVHNNFIVSNGFEKVSYEEFLSSMEGFRYSDEELQDIYDQIILPSRASDGSAGYDFYIPFNMDIHPGHIVKIPTGIKCQISSGWALWVIPKSGLGCKYGLRLLNTVGLIDSDYYNTGHPIILNLIYPNLEDNNFNQTDIIKLKKGNKFCQGVFLPYGIVKNDNNTEKVNRTGGFGSTGR